MVESLVQFIITNAKEISAFSLVIICVLLFVAIVIPKAITYLFSYLKEKDKQHRDDIMTLINDARKERTEFYTVLSTSMSGVENRLSNIEIIIKNFDK